jgi:lipopolysaccharide export system permease protein
MLKAHPTLYRYVLLEFMKIFALSVSSLIFIYMIVLFLGKLTTFGRYDAPFYLIFEYLFYKTPEVLFLWTLPYGVLLSTVLTLGNFSRNSEITAMKAGGISLYNIVVPLLFVAFIVSLFSFLGKEYLVPLANQKSIYLMDVKVRKEKYAGFFKNFKIWYRSDNRIFNIQLLDDTKKVLKGLTVYELDDAFHCTRRIDAQEAKWENGKWRLYHGVVRNFDVSDSIQNVPFTEMEFPLRETWDSFLNIEGKPDDMSYSQLYTYIQKIRAAGYDATRYVVDLHGKLSIPFLNLVMVLVGIPFALKTGRSGGMALNIGVSVMVGFICGVTFYVFIVFGRYEILPPLISAWVPIVLFGLAGIFTLMSVPQ